MFLGLLPIRLTADRLTVPLIDPPQPYPLYFANAMHTNIIIIIFLPAPPEGQGVGLYLTPSVCLSCVACIHFTLWPKSKVYA